MASAEGINSTCQSEAVKEAEQCLCVRVRVRVKFVYEPEATAAGGEGAVMR